VRVQDAGGIRKDSSVGQIGKLTERLRCAVDAFPEWGKHTVQHLDKDRQKWDFTHDRTFNHFCRLADEDEKCCEHLAQGNPKLLEGFKRLAEHDRGGTLEAHTRVLQASTCSEEAERWLEEIENWLEDVYKDEDCPGGDPGRLLLGKQDFNFVESSYKRAVGALANALMAIQAASFKCWQPVPVRGMPTAAGRAPVPPPQPQCAAAGAEARRNPVQAPPPTQARHAGEHNRAFFENMLGPGVDPQAFMESIMGPGFPPGALFGPDADPVDPQLLWEKMPEQARAFFEDMIGPYADPQACQQEFQRAEKARCKEVRRREAEAERAALRAQRELLVAEEKSQKTKCDKCEAMVEKSALKKHKKNDCPMRITSCQECNESMPFCCLQDHRKHDCEAAPVECDLCKTCRHSWPS